MNNLRESLTEYLAMRRALGYKLYKAGKGLTDFVSFLEQRGESYITTRLALEWAQQPTTVQPNGWAKRLGYVRVFAKYLSAIDLRTEVPSSELLPYKPKRARPYLYTQEEVQLLLTAALNLPPVNGLRGLTYYSLFGLLAVTGMRISEALNLKVEDVDLNEGILTIRGAKFGKTRLVPLHPSTRLALCDYKVARDLASKDRAAVHFFVNKRCNRLNESTVEETFRLAYVDRTHAKDHGSMIFATDWPWKPYCSGIEVALTLNVDFLCYRHIWGMFTSVIRTGI